MAHFKGALTGFISMNLLLLTAVAQFDLSQLHTRTVKQNQPRGYINTVINHLAVNITVNKGVVTTEMELTLTPDSALIYEYTFMGMTNEKANHSKVFIDSLETAAYFYLDANTAITDLYLWVGEEKVRGYLQERTLASAQYESIVQRRRDPLLIETRGNGGYSLKLFPLESGQTRKFQLQFVQGMENNNDGVYTALPLMFRQYPEYNPMVSNAEREHKTIEKLSVTVQSTDGKAYALKWKDLGDLVVTMAPQTVTRENVNRLGIGKLTDPDKANTLKAWTGTKNSKSYFGVKSTLIYKELVVEKEPLERIFILDAPDNGKDLELAKKLALLALKSYVRKNQIFNLGLMDQQGTLSLIFNVSLPMTEANLAKAYQHLIDWAGSANGHPLSSLEKYATGKSIIDNTIVLLISNQQLYYPIPHPQKSVNPDLDKQLWELYNSTHNAWLESENKRAHALIDAFKEKKLMLFGFWNASHLSQVAIATGGDQLGNFGGSYYWRYLVYSDEVAIREIGGTFIALPENRLYIPPPLFGPGRPGKDGPQNIEITTSGIPVTGLGVLKNDQYYSYPRMGNERPGIIIVDDAPILTKKASPIRLYYPSNKDSLGVRVSGNYTIPGILTIHITGTWNGLAFSKRETFSLGPSLAGSPLAAGLWAYQKSEDLRTSDYNGNIEAIKALGREHHVVNSQMSLLALEPGMELWKELPNSEGANISQSDAIQLSASNGVGPEADFRGIMPLIDSGATGVMNLDNITLADILKAKTGLTEDLPSPGKRPISLAVQVGSTVHVNISGLSGSETVGIQIRNLSGKLVTRLKGEHKGGTYQAEWRPEKKRNGIYVALVNINGMKLVKRIILSR